MGWGGVGEGIGGRQATGSVVPEEGLGDGGAVGYDGVEDMDKRTQPGGPSAGM